MDIFTRELYVLIGTEEDHPNVSHKLFFSGTDNKWFVAIQNDDDGSVITIIPSAYYYQIGRISQSLVDYARRLVALPFHFGAVLAHSAGNTRVVSLGTLGRPENGWYVYEALRRKEVGEILANRLLKIIEHGEVCTHLQVAIGPDEVPQEFAL